MQTLSHHTRTNTHMNTHENPRSLSFPSLLLPGQTIIFYSSQPLLFSPQPTFALNKTREA